MEDRIHTKSKQLTIDDRLSLSKCLQRGLNLTNTAKYLKCDVSTVKREIDRNKKIKHYLYYKNQCSKRNICKKHNVCGNTKCTHLCSTCVKPYTSCDQFCDEATDIPICKKLKHLCGVCNGCTEYANCKQNKYLYDYTEADRKHKVNIVDSHKGARLTKEELKEFADFLRPLLNHNQSLDVIKNTNKDIFPYSIQTVYNWVDLGLLPGIDNVMMPRKVRYSARKKKQKASVNSRQFLQGRLYEDFLIRISEDPYLDVVEMDTVEGANHSSFIMTLLFRQSNFMLAFKLKDHTAESIVEVFNDIKKKLGKELFKKVFPIILTDRGVEFTDPEGIENDIESGKKLISVYFCDSRQSQQKGKIEKNHEELRKICPKGFDFNSINQDDLNLALNHVNSYPRKILNYHTPYEKFSTCAFPEVLMLNNSIKISAREVNLTTSLLRTKK